MKEKLPVEKKVIPKEELEMAEYVPYGANTSIKLSIALVRRLLTQPTKNGKQASDDDCIKYIAMCRAKQLNPFEGDCFLIGYDDKETKGATFSQITAHQVFLKRAEVSDDFDGMQSGVIVENEDGVISEIEGDFHTPDQTVIGGWAKVYLKSRKFPWYKRLRLSAYSKNSPFWRDNPAGQICKCAEGDALRSAFPTMLGGLYNAAELTVIPQQSHATYSSDPDFTRPVIKATPKQEQISDKKETIEVNEGKSSDPEVLAAVDKASQPPTTPIDELIP